MSTGSITTSYITQIILMIIASYTLLQKSRKIKKQFIILSVYFVIAGLTDIAGFIITQLGMYDVALYRMFNIVEFILLASMFITMENEVLYKIILILLAVIGTIIISVGNSVNFTNANYSYFYMALSYLILFLMDARIFYWTFRISINTLQSPQFWITVGFGFFFAVNSLALLLWTSNTLILGAYISITINIINNLIILWSYRWMYKQPTLKL